MDVQTKKINELLVDCFNTILFIEENEISSGSFNDLTMTEIHAIEAIDRSGDKTMGSIAKKLKVTLGTWTIACNKIEKKGFIKKEKSSKDKRVVYVSLTKKGESALKAHRVFHSKMISEALVNISDDEKKILIRALDRIYDFFNEKNIGEIEV